MLSPDQHNKLDIAAIRLRAAWDELRTAIRDDHGSAYEHISEVTAAVSIAASVYDDEAALMAWAMDVLHLHDSDVAGGGR